MNNLIIKIPISLFLLCFTLFLQCSTSEFSGIEVTNGNCHGKIYNDNSSNASGALVRLIPSGYDPTVLLSGKIDSTYTRSDGTYSFLVTNSGFYTVIAEKQNKFCKQDSVSVLSDIDQTLSSDTLAEPGYLSANVRVKPKSDARKVIILFAGTNFFISPSDSSGRLSTVNLPEGRYRLKAFTTEEGYGIYDTSIVISSEEKLEITITIPISYTPEITGAFANYDSSRFNATINWLPADTSQFMSYALHRFINNIEDTVIIIDKKVTYYNDSCRNFFSDTISYKISTIGKNYKEGYLTSTKPFIVKMNAEIKNKIVFGTPGLFIRSIKPIAKDFLCFFSNSTIFRCSSDGTVIEVLDEEQSRNLFPFGIPSIDVDSSNNIYAIPNYFVGIQKTAAVCKMNDDFNILDTLLTDDTELDQIIIGTDGSVYFKSSSYCLDTNICTEIKVFDPSFNFKKKFMVNEAISIKRCFRGRIFAIENKRGPSDNNYPAIMVYDSSFNLLSKIKTAEFCEDIVSENLFVTSATENGISKYSVWDIQGNKQSDISVPSEINYLTISSGTMFFSKRNSLFVFSINH